LISHVFSYLFTLLGVRTVTKNRNGPQPKVAELLGKRMGNKAKLKRTLII